MKPAEIEALQGATSWGTNRNYKGVLYGEFGMRKTTTAVRCMQHKCILIYADPGWHVVKNHPDEFDEGNVVPVRYEGLSQIRSILTAIQEGIEPFAGADLIVIDTISQVQENYIDFLLENAQYGGNYREKASAKPGKKLEDGEREIEIPGMPDYHLARNKIRPVVTALTEFPIDVIFLAHTREPSPIEKAAGKIEKRPNITEALYKVISRNATFIGYMEKDKNKEYTVTFAPTKTLSAKSQVPSLTDQTINSSDLPSHLADWKKS